MRSDIALDLPVLSDVSDVGTPQETRIDVDVELGDERTGTDPAPASSVLAVLETDGAPWYTLIADGDGYLMRFDGCGDFVISPALDHVVVRPQAGGRTEILPILFAGTVSAALLALRGCTVLHASAVSVDGSAIAFTGQSGRGKTTMAALMCLGGAELVAEDVLRVEPGAPVVCHGAITHLRLRDGATDIVERFSTTSRHLTVDRRHAVMPTAAPGPVPLSAVVIPSPSRVADVVSVHRLEPGDALVALLSFPRVHGWRDEGVLRRDFATLAQVVSAVPVVEAVIPWGPPFRLGIVTELVEALRLDAGRS